MRLEAVTDSFYSVQIGNLKGSEWKQSRMETDDKHLYSMVATLSKSVETKQ